MLLDDAGVEHGVFQVESEGAGESAVDAGCDVLYGLKITVVAAWPGLHVMTEGGGGHDAADTGEGVGNLIGRKSGEFEGAREKVDLMEGGRCLAVGEDGICAWVGFVLLQRVRKVGGGLELSKLKGRRHERLLRLGCVGLLAAEYMSTAGSGGTQWVGQCNGC